MRMPALLYGRYRDVRKKCQNAFRQFPKGEPWLHALTAEGLCKTTKHSGLLLLEGPSPLLGTDVLHFHCYLPLLIVHEKWTTTTDSEVDDIC